MGSARTYMGSGITFSVGFLWKLSITCNLSFVYSTYVLLGKYLVKLFEEI